MGIKKSTVRKHFEDKYEARKAGIKDNRDTTIKLILEPYLKEVYLDFDTIAQKAVELHDLLQKETERHMVGMSSTWDYRDSYLSDLMRVTRIKQRYVERLNKRITAFLEGSADYVTTDPAVSPKLLQSLEKLRKFWQEEDLKLDQLNTLQREIRTVINNAGSGNKAIEDLKTLGLSTEGIEQTQVREQLPAIQKFSVNVCLLEDTCHEHEEEAK